MAVLPVLLVAIRLALALLRRQNRLRRVIMPVMAKTTNAGRKLQLHRRRARILTRPATHAVPVRKPTRLTTARTTPMKSSTTPMKSSDGASKTVAVVVTTRPSLPWPGGDTGTTTTRRGCHGVPGRSQLALIYSNFLVVVRLRFYFFIK